MAATASHFQQSAGHRPHLGSDPDTPPAFAYCRRRRRPFSRRNALDLLPSELLPTGRGAESAVPSLIPAGPATGLRRRQPAILLHPGTVANAASLPTLPR